MGWFLSPAVVAGRPTRPRRAAVSRQRAWAGTSRWPAWG
jgi:hypothetical protein